jgi:hypothetical protein
MRLYTTTKPGKTMGIRKRTLKKKLVAAQSQGRQLLAIADKEPEAFKFLEEAVQQFPEDPEIRLL